jgi:hypothetical protein
VFGQRGPVAAGALDPDPRILTEPIELCRELLVAGLTGWHRELAEDLSKPVKSYGDVLVLVRVHACCDHEFLLISRV